MAAMQQAPDFYFDTVNKVLPFPPVKRLMKYLTTRTAAGIKLPDYSAREQRS